MELRSLTDAPPELLKQVRKLNLGVLPVQCPEFCYKRAVRDAKRLSWAAILIPKATSTERASNKSDSAIVAGAIIAEFEPLNRAVHVRTLAVEPRYRRQGVARQLIDRVIKQALASRQAPTEGGDSDGAEAVCVESVRLHVHVGNADGIAFYQSAGFTEQERLENYYRHLEPRACLVLSYALPDEDHDKPASEG
ncbi:Rave complex subunit rav1/dmx protein [Globisporangium polare]